VSDYFLRLNTAQFVYIP